MHVTGGMYIEEGGEGDCFLIPALLVSNLYTRFIARSDHGERSFLAFASAVLLRSAVSYVPRKTYSRQNIP